MNAARHVASPPDKPLMLYDGDCGFCRLWVRRWQQLTGDAVDYLPFQDVSVSARYPEIEPRRFEAAVHFIDTKGAVFDGAAAVFQALATQPSKRWPLELYERSPRLARASEAAYRVVAENRVLFSRLTRIFWGNRVEVSAGFLARWLFLRGLALVYLVAFLSLWTQIGGLLGHDGILPAAELMARARGTVAAQGIHLDRYHLLPTLCWFGTSDTFLRAQCAAGALLAVVLLLGVAPPLCLGLMWLLYLSLATVGQDFLSFQWDNLLLEVGLLAVFLAPLQLWPRPSREPHPSRVVLGLLWLLLFKLMFQSGCVKLLSGDATWRDLTALTCHYETQPLPTWIGWYAHQLPAWFQHLSCGAMFLLEVGVPFLIWGPRRVRLAGALALAGLQCLILLTGNYTFFNWLALLLCLLLVDDFALARVLPRRLVAAYAGGAAGGGGPRGRPWPRGVLRPLTVTILLLTLFELLVMFRFPPGWGGPVTVVYRWLAPFRSVNSYGLFAVMTTRRQEIVVEGSADGDQWKPYEFKYKPGDPLRRPGFVAPHQPRLDWQMWFAALGSYRENPWFVGFCLRLLEGSSDVQALLRTNPFPDQPPRFVRARLYDYRFTNAAERRQTGAWWKRELAGDYLPPISLPVDGPRGLPDGRSHSASLPAAR